MMKAGHSHPKSVVVAFPSKARGGCEEYALRIAQSLHEQGHTVHALFPCGDQTLTLRNDFNKFAKSYQSLNLHYWETGRFRRLRLVWDTLRIVAQLLRTRPDAVHISLPWPDTATELILACSILRLRTVIVFQLVADNFRISKKLQGWYAWGKSRDQNWVAVSENNRQILSRAFNMPAEEIHLISNGNFNPKDRSDTVFAQNSAQSLPNTGPFILAVARLSKQKGLDILLKAFANLSQRYHSYNIYVLGEGEEREFLVKLAENLGLADRVYFLGHRTDVSDWLDHAALYLHPSRSEGQSFALMEAMNYGLPIIASDSSSIPELIENNKEGLLFRSDDEKDLTEKLQWAFENPEEMARMGGNARKKSKLFSGGEMIRKTLFLIGIQSGHTDMDS